MGNKRGVSQEEGRGSLLPLWKDWLPGRGLPPQASQATNPPEENIEVWSRSGRPKDEV